MKEEDRFEQELTKELNDCGLFPVPRTIRAFRKFAFKWFSQDSNNLERAKRMASKWPKWMRDVRLTKYSKGIK